MGETCSKIHFRKLMMKKIRMLYLENLLETSQEELVSINIVMEQLIQQVDTLQRLQMNC